MGEGGDEGGWGKGQIGECRVRGVWEERSVVAVFRAIRKEGWWEWGWGGGGSNIRLIIGKVWGEEGEEGGGVRGG